MRLKVNLSFYYEDVINIIFLYNLESTNNILIVEDQKEREEKKPKQKVLNK